MSFVRDDARALLWRWREVALTGALCLWGIHLVGRAVDRSSLGLALVAAGVLCVGAVLFFYAVLRAQVRRGAIAEGAVEVDEREVRYLLADGGAMVSLDDLVRLEVMVKDEAGFWVLSHLAGPPLVIPAGAQGADALFDAFSALPGVRIEDAVRGLGAASGRITIWERAII
ncbi:MAG: hypothetical protein AAF761_11245 [Pseudomonadota bacterium]